MDTTPLFTMALRTVDIPLDCTVAPYLWLTCDTCIAGYVSIAIDDRPQAELATLLTTQASLAGWELTPLARCPRCVAENWHDPIPV